jgi:hypothetical protein
MSPLPAAAEPIEHVPGPLYGLIGEFDSPSDLVAAAQATHEEGYRSVDAYSPFPIHEMTAALGLKKTKLPLVVLVGGLLGCGTALLMQWFAAAVHYPINVGGRPLASWPMFIPITFEMTILAAGISAVLGMFILNRLPMPYHPVFNAPRFALASSNRYFLVIQATDPKLDREATRALLLSLGAHEVTDVEP